MEEDSIIVCNEMFIIIRIVKKRFLVYQKDVIASEGKLVVGLGGLKAIKKKWTHFKT